MSFNCLTVDKNWTALAPETSLIDYYKGEPGVCKWNGNAFGIHDPGRKRETTNKDPLRFDSRYPIRKDWPCTFVDARSWNILELLTRMKKEFLFLVRYQKKNYRSGHSDYNDIILAVPSNDIPAVDLMRLFSAGDTNAGIGPGKETASGKETIFEGVP